MFWSPCRCTLMLFFSPSFKMCPHMYYDFRQALISSTGVPQGTTGRVCRKSLDSANVDPPISLSLPRMSFIVLSSALNVSLWLIVHLAQTISLHPFSNLASLVHFLMLHTGLSVLARFSRTSAECQNSGWCNGKCNVLLFVHLSQEKAENDGLTVPPRADSTFFRGYHLQNSVECISLLIC